MEASVVANPKYQLREQLATIGSAWANAAPQDKEPPTITSYLLTKERLTDQTQAYDFRIDCEAKSFAAAESLADAVRDHAAWPWPLIFPDEKDDVRAPEDAGAENHIVSIHIQLHAP